MNSLTQRILIPVLIALQMLAPLVHAHTNAHDVAGLHLPGLEFYKSASIQPEMCAANVLYESDGYVVGVDAGLQIKKILKILDDAPTAVIVPAVGSILTKLPDVLLLKLDFFESPNFSHSVGSQYLSRAPPIFPS